MTTWLRLVLTVAGLALAGFFIAAMGPQLEPISAANEPGIPGKFGWHFVLGFALILGWALGAGLEVVWRESNGGAQKIGERFLLAVAPRLVAGFFLFFAIEGAAFLFEAWGVGLRS